MSKQLVSVDNLDEFICKADGKMYVDGTIILTPGAKDELSKRHIDIVYGSAPHQAGNTCGCGSGCPECAGNAFDPDVERLILGVAGMLQTEYGIKDPEQLRALSLQAVKTLKENI